MFSCTFKATDTNGDMVHITATTDEDGGCSALSESFPGTMTFAGSIAYAVESFCESHDLKNPVPVDAELLEVISYLVQEVLLLQEQFRSIPGETTHGILIAELFAMVNDLNNKVKILEEQNDNFRRELRELDRRVPI